MGVRIESAISSHGYLGKETPVLRAMSSGLQVFQLQVPTSALLHLPWWASENIHACWNRMERNILGFGSKQHKTFQS